MEEIEYAKALLLKKMETLEEKRQILKAPELKDLYTKIKDQPADQRAAFGQAVNELKMELEAKVADLQPSSSNLSPIDVTAPFDVNAEQPSLLPTENGTIHPITREMQKISEIFYRMGFEVSPSREIDDEYHMFTSLNFPEDHPARDMQDTFWIKPQKGSKERPVLRTHNTSATARALAQCKNEFPIRKIFPGKVFRNEATDATHEAQFYQLDGVYVDKKGKVSLADLKSTLLYYYRKILGDDVEIQFRPSYFSFTEPSAEVWVKFKDRWLEVMGSGMLSGVALPLVADSIDC